MSNANQTNPGSPEAVSLGCTCPVLDNHHGAGWRGGVVGPGGETLFVFAGSCPLHGQALETGDEPAQTLGERVEAFVGAGHTVDPNTGGPRIPEDDLHELHEIVRALVLAKYGPSDHKETPYIECRLHNRQTHWTPECVAIPFSNRDPYGALHCARLNAAAANNALDLVFKTLLYGEPGKAIEAALEPYGEPKE